MERGSIKPILPFYALAGAVFAMAIALGYFAYVLAGIGKDLPEVLEQLEVTGKALEPFAQETSEIRLIIPEILDEVEAVRLAIPPILEEVQEVRNQVPGILEETASIREDLPGLLARTEQILLEVEPILTEIQAIREETLPAVLSETSTIRETTIPDVLAAITRLQREIPVYLARAEGLVEDASEAGMRASEGAVSGLFTGILRAPVSLVGQIGRVFPKSSQLTAEDQEHLAVEMALMLETEPGFTRPFDYPTSNLTGSITFLERTEVGEEIRQRMRMKAQKGNRAVLDVELHFARVPPGEWEVIETTSN